MSADRAGYVAGLRALADILEQNESLPLPSAGNTSPLDWWIWPRESEDPKVTLAAIVRLIPGAKSKYVGENGGTSWLTVTAKLHGLRIDINTHRDAVCTRVVKGTREVTEEVPDPDALAAVPTVTVTKTIEDVEWECSPILAAHEQYAAEVAAAAEQLPA